uniref:Uncharacterized protein n=1 Tax=Trypanosoma vivax (strain Y486) TaxID=1055687 RepID=G0TVP3_TRYVY|nr:conserved hypothetical protein [Trypanosoma vivax Y486]
MASGKQWQNIVDATTRASHVFVLDFCEQRRLARDCTGKKCAYVSRGLHGVSCSFKVCRRVLQRWANMPLTVFVQNQRRNVAVLQLRAVEYETVTWAPPFTWRVVAETAGSSLLSHLCSFM